MPNYKVQFLDKKKPVCDEILVTADSPKNAIREGCRIGNLKYPTKYTAKITVIDLSNYPSKAEAKAE